jgi:hypothetical protein
MASGILPKPSLAVGRFSLEIIENLLRQVTSIYRALPWGTRLVHRTALQKYTTGKGLPAATAQGFDFIKNPRQTHRYEADLRNTGDGLVGVVGHAPATWATCPRISASMKPGSRWWQGLLF